MMIFYVHVYGRVSFVKHKLFKKKNKNPAILNINEIFIM